MAPPVNKQQQRSGREMKMEKEDLYNVEASVIIVVVTHKPYRITQPTTNGNERA